MCDLTRELGEVSLDEHGYELYRDWSDEDTRSWLFNRVIPAGDCVIACFRDVAKPGEEIQIPLRREEAIKFAQAIQSP